MGNLNKLHLCRSNLCLVISHLSRNPNHSHSHSLNPSPNLSPNPLLCTSLSHTTNRKLYLLKAILINNRNNPSHNPYNTLRSFLFNRSR